MKGLGGTGGNCHGGWVQLAHVLLLVHLGHFSGACLKSRHNVGSVHFVAVLFAQETAENFFEALAEVLGDQGIYDGVEAGVGIGHAVGKQAEGIGGLVEGEVSVEVSEDDYMVGQPAEAEKDGYNDDHLGYFPPGLLGL